MEGFCLLGSHLGNPERKILTGPQIRNLTRRMQLVQQNVPDRVLSVQDLLSLGYGSEQAENILYLLNGKEQMDAYLAEGSRQNCHLLTRGEPAYPGLLRKQLGAESPCCLFYKGNPELLNTPGVALVGSRDLSPANREFAREAGRQAALHGLTLISGNARGADQTAQQACLAAGGSVISVVADELFTKREDPGILYVSQEDWDAPFSAARALSRNRVIHAMGFLTMVAQCGFEAGGTWSGTTQNLRQGWSVVVCFRDGSQAAMALEARGAYLVSLEDLSRLTEFRNPQISLFDEIGELM